MIVDLDGTVINLPKDLNFHHTLNKDQLEAIDKMVEFFDSDKLVGTLQGSAGTGKTTLVKILLKYLNMSGTDYVLAAPTHKAKSVMSNSTSEDVVTLHSLLNLRPDIEIEKFNAKDLKLNRADSSFAKKFEDPIPYRGVVIIDESSMINDELYEYILQSVKKNKSKILFIGDSAQLQPVKQDTLSKVFTKTDYNYKLTIIERQKDDNPILDYLSILRDKKMNNFLEVGDKEKGLTVLTSVTQLLQHYKDNVKFNDPFNARVLTFTNKMTEVYNKYIRSKVYGITEEYVVGDLIMGYDTKMINDTVIIRNGYDYVITDVEKVNIHLPNFATLPGYRLTFYDPSDEFTTIETIEVLSKQLPKYIYQALARTLELFREMALVYRANKKETISKQYWRKFYALDGAICSPEPLEYDNRLIKKKLIDYGYAHTVHKSQGCTYKNVYVDMQDILNCGDDDVTRQLQYVALSRATNKVNLLL